ncbi:MAG: PKD domain-containing protein, partial [Anaerolineales bacterium]
FKIETTSELGPNTLSRIDDLNGVLDRGVEIGPETRATIEMLNDTISEGIKFGFTDDMLARVDAMLSIVEEGIGIKLGLDPETNATVNRLIDTIDAAPGQWEGTVTEIIQTLESSTSNVADHMADQVRDLMSEARVNVQYMTATVGVEFRCNVDFLGARAGDTVEQFMGRTLIGRLRNIISGDQPETAVPVPWVCQIIPDQIDLVETESGILFDTAVVKISGYNFQTDNMPVTYIVDEAGQPVPSEQLYPFLSSPYQIQLNVQDIDFSAIPPRSRVVFDWPTTGTSYALAMVFPSEAPEPTAVVRAELTVSAASLDVRKGPGMDYLVIGRAEAGAVYEVTGQNGDGSWFQIDYDGTEGWVPATAVVRNDVATGVASIPLPPPNADFIMDVTTGDAPLEIHFTDHSGGSPIRWEWDFGDGEFSYDTNPTHTFDRAGTYQVELKVENNLGFGTTTRSIVVDQPEFIFLPPRIEMVPLLHPTATPSFPSGSIFFKTFTRLGNDVQFNTNIDSTQYTCGVVSMAALNGDIEESGRGNIIWAYMTPQANRWWIHANFKTHHNSETWSLGVMCLNNAYSTGFFVPERQRVNPPSTTDLEGIPEGYFCGVVGMGAWNGDINESGSGEIIKVYATPKGGGEWELTADFRTHGDTEEVWDLNLICVYDNPSIFKHDTFSSLRGNTPFDTGRSASQYACGIVGMAGLWGDINEKDTGDIMRVYTYIGPNGNWYILADFRSHNNDERWDITTLCVDRSAATLQGDWTENWVKR